MKRSLASQQKAVQEYVVSLQEAERARALAEEQVNAVRAKLQEVCSGEGILSKDLWGRRYASSVFHLIKRNMLPCSVGITSGG